jgi:hypothetical protein
MNVSGDVAPETVEKLEDAYEKSIEKVSLRLE